MQVRQPSRPHRSGSGSSEAYRDKYRRYPVPAGRVATLGDEELLSPDPEAQDVEPPEIDQIEGCQDEPGYEPLPAGGVLLLCVQHDGPFCMGLPSPQNLLSLAQGAFKLQGGRVTK